MGYKEKEINEEKYRRNVEGQRLMITQAFGNWRRGQTKKKEKVRGY